MSTPSPAQAIPSTPIQNGQRPDWLTTIHPFGTYALSGLTTLGDGLLALDQVFGYLLWVDRRTDNTVILNPEQTPEFMDATGIAFWEDTLWFTRGNTIYICKNALASFQLEPPVRNRSRLDIQAFVRLPDEVDGIAVYESTLYVTCQRRASVLVLSAVDGRQITHFPAPGVGFENITVHCEHLWLTDTIEQSVYCMDRATGQVQFNLLVPFPNPRALTFALNAETIEEMLYVAYADQEIYIRDNPNADPPYELTNRDRTFIHPLHFRFHTTEKSSYILSNGFLVEMSYVEELQPTEAVQSRVLEDLEWRIALPSNTDRQQVREVTAIGMPFTLETEDDQQVAVFRFPRLSMDQRHIFGWRALLEVWSIKYQITPRQVAGLADPGKLPEGFRDRYLVDNDNLMMDSPIIQEAAQEAAGGETNLLRKMLRIRNYVYDKLSYGIKPYIDPPDQVLRRGVGSCGEYLGLLLALARLNGIACRTVGRYKCPTRVFQPLVNQEPEFNHVWLEFYIPEVGWLPMESNPDDVQEGGPYPTRFFMGASWYHTELGKGIPFETLWLRGKRLTKEDLSIGHLARNHVRFRILSELKP